MPDRICEVSEYDCWFQPRKRTLSADISRALGKIRMEEKGEIIENAKKELYLGLQRGFDILFDSDIGSEGATLLGTISFLNKKFGTDIPEQKSEGFFIKIDKSGIIIGGQDEKGTLYGVYRFLLLLARGKIKTAMEIIEAPASSVRMISHWDNMAGPVHRGYGGPSLFFKENRIDYDPKRIEDYARLLASIGINRLSLNNVNVKGVEPLLITDTFLPDIAKLADIFRPFGIRLMVCINFASPMSIGKLSTADPLDPEVAEWWKRQTDIVYRHISDWAGFIVKADSEFEMGPFDYGRTHADGANMLADALKPHGGELIWRCFVYNCTQDWRDQKTDRARAAYDIFKPLDGTFRDNVILEIKYGPYDFQIREPITPLFGALLKTRYMMEMMITQEYTGQAIDLCYLPSQWEDIMNFNTHHGLNTKIKDLLRSRSLEGIAAIPNVGRDNNWTGHHLAQANLYGYGRIIWDPDLSAEEIADEWASLTFNNPEVSNTVCDILIKSYPTMEKYLAPFGNCFMVVPVSHYDPSPEGYEFSKWGTYHRADQYAIGIDRTPSGTGYTEQYAKENTALFANPKICPENVILFFHRLRYDFKMRNGETLLQNIYNNHFEGYDEVLLMLKKWKTLKGKLDENIYSPVLGRMEKQLLNAREWRDVINTYFWRKTGIGDARGRKIYD
jgi:alpha-glucuronidase